MRGFEVLEVSIHQVAADEVLTDRLSLEKSVSETVPCRKTGEGRQQMFWIFAATKG